MYQQAGPQAGAEGPGAPAGAASDAVSYTHLRAHETPEHLVCRLLLEKKKNPTNPNLLPPYNPPDAQYPITTYRTTIIT